MEKKGLIYAGFTALLWGFLAIALKVSLYDLSPVSVVWFRFTVAFVFLFIILQIHDRNLIKKLKRPPWYLFLAAFFLGLNYLGFITGIHYTSPSSAQVYIQIGPVSLAIAGIVIFRERLTWQHIMGFLMLVAGFYLFYSQQVDLKTDGKRFTLGILFVLGGGMSWALFSIFQKILVRRFNTNHLNLFIYGTCALLFLPWVEFERFSGLTLNDWLLLIFLGINTLLAYGSLAYALRYSEANKVAVIITINPIITFGAMAFLEFSAVTWIEFEEFTPWSITGALAVLAGALVVVMSRGKEGNSESGFK